RKPRFEAALDGLLVAWQFLEARLEFRPPPQRLAIAIVGVQDLPVAQRARVPFASDCLGIRVFSFAVLLEGLEGSPTGRIWSHFNNSDFSKFVDHPNVPRPTSAGKGKNRPGRGQP